jgi:RNase P protein component
MARVAGERPNERMGLKKAAFVYQLQALANSGADEEDKVITQLRAAIVRSKDFPEEVFRYRIIAYDDANKIQTVARNRVPRFLESAFSCALRQECLPYEAVSLATTRISAGDFEAFKQYLPPDLRSNCLFDHWLMKGTDNGNAAVFNEV